MGIILIGLYALGIAIVGLKVDHQERAKQAEATRENLECVQMEAEYAKDK